MDEPPQTTVADPSPIADPVVIDIASRFPGWSAWYSDTRRWWAYRTAAAPLTIGQLRAGCRLLVHAETHAELCAAITAEIEAARRAVRPEAAYA